MIWKKLKNVIHLTKSRVKSMATGDHGDSGAHAKEVWMQNVLGKKQERDCVIALNPSMEGNSVQDKERKIDIVNPHAPLIVYVENSSHGRFVRSPVDIALEKCV